MPARLVTSLNDWYKVNAVAEKFLQSGWTDRIPFGRTEFEKYFVKAVDDPVNWACILMESTAGDPKGLVILQQQGQYELIRNDNTGESKLVLVPYGFILGAYNAGGYQLGKDALEVVEHWCRQRGHTEIQARMVIASVLSNDCNSVSHDGKKEPRRRLTALFKQYGFEETHVLIRKEL